MWEEVYEKIYAEIVAHPVIIVHRHVRPDPDALGSQRGLTLLLRNQFPAKEVYAVGENDDNLAYLGMMDEVDAEKYPQALVMVLDTANRPRISDKRYTKGKTLIKLDHHPDEDPYGDISLVNTGASSTSEIIADFARYLGDRLPMTKEAARLLYAGIVGDTGRFLYPATTSHTMQIVSWLMEQDFSASEVGQLMNTNPKKIANLAGFVLQNLILDDLGVGYIVLTQDILDQFQAVDSDTAPVVPLPGTIEGVICWGIFVEQPGGTFRARLRSKGPVINEVAKRHGGGGHPLASGANAQDEAEIREIIREFEKLAVEWKQKQEDRDLA